MKHFAVIFMAALAMASSDPICDDCKDAVRELSMYLGLPPVIEITKGRLIKDVCSGDADCAAFLDSQYFNLFNVIVTQDGYDRTVCTMSHYCTDRTGLTRQSNVFDCNGCQDFLDRMKQLLSNPLAQEKLSIALSGPLFCEASFYQESVEECRVLVFRHLRNLMKVAASMIVEHQTRLCFEIAGRYC